MSTYSRVRASGLANRTPCQPSETCGPLTPRPSRKRPPERLSRLTAAIAVAAGCRADIWVIAVPRRTFEVPDPHQASGVRPSEP